MTLSRRRVGQIVLALAATGASYWPGSRLARPAGADQGDYPVLRQLASLYPDEAACRRIASAASPAVLLQMTDATITRTEQAAARMWRKCQGAARKTLDAVLADDFRRGRTVLVAGFLLAETEAILVFMRGSGATGPSGLAH